MTQCGDCNKVLEKGEIVYNIGVGKGIWVCEDCFRSTIDSRDLDRFEQIKDDAPSKIIQ